MVRFNPISTQIARHYQAGGPDANGQPPEQQTCDSPGNPCRHCLQMIPIGAQMLVLAHRPFPALQPYAETGPIFLCADPCPAGGGAHVPDILASADYIVRGYGHDDRIVYGTGAVIATPQIAARADQLLRDPKVAYVHVRSARNNCFQCRIDRA